MRQIGCYMVVSARKLCINPYIESLLDLYSLWNVNNNQASAHVIIERNVTKLGHIFLHLKQKILQH